MGLTECQPEAARKELDRVLASSRFARNERMSRFLRFVVDRHLEGRDEELKESLIAIEVFSRKPDYDPKQDSIVRSEAARLRARLIEYYAREGGSDPIIIELPRGGYVPVVRRVVSEHGARLQPPRAWVSAAVGCLAAGLVAAAWWWIDHKSAPVTIAVLPLDNLSHDPANDYFSDGLTDELIRNLSLIDGLAPRSRTSSFAFKGKPRNVQEVGKLLKADYVLEGSVLRAGQQLRINIQLVRASDDFPLWSGRYDRELTDVLAMQDDISRGVVNSLRLKLGRGRRRYETNVEAYDLYLRALAIPKVQDRVELYRQAIAKDPTFAPAYAGLADSYAYRSGFPELDRQAELANMRMAAEKAIQLDPLLAEAHAAAGEAYARDGQWSQSEKSFSRALKIDPNSSTSDSNLAVNLLLPLGRVEEAIERLRAAENTDPLSQRVQFRLAYALLIAGRFDEADIHCQKAANAECLGRVRLGQGRIREGVSILEAAVNRGIPESDVTRGYLGYAYGRAGRREEAEQVAQAQQPFAFQQALVFAGLGARDRTLEAMDRMTALGPIRIGRDLLLPEFAFVRGDPRFKALRKKVGLPQ